MNLKTRKKFNVLKNLPMIDDASELKDIFDIIIERYIAEYDDGAQVIIDISGALVGSLIGLLKK